MPAIDRHAARLAADGYCVVPRVVEPEVIADLEADLALAFAATPMGKGVFYGERTRRFGSLLKRSPLAAQLVQQSTILGIVEQMLLPWCDRIALNLTQAIEIHPGAPAQLPHRDQDMWPGPKGGFEYLVNVMWPLTTFTADNGGTRLWPFSHLDQDVPLLPEAEAIVPPVLPGDALLFLGSSLHGGGANLSGRPRRGIIVSYCLGWLKPFELQWLVYPPSIARTFSPELAALVGYAQHRPNLGNVEGQCPSILFDDDVPEHIGAVDALRPDQVAAAAAFAAESDDQP
ncbi:MULTISPECIES: phytanoyl-CoA dioxygenase family protein [unclassified Sphingomonas]|uniref:phytanoyl-CoA dioxygenase family protein n=1 Tax=unclassified Sphingomonas TaxID=196159 RepID=UPI0006F7EAC4|nr:MULTISPECIES: phytanoyl-CoA dioxygenase family protein [unclassified Sphingomonas]KQX19144.1 phytanoyl-CoA dioxygenase [Sphingomonas sp. Root1294]KQY65345.1 phytanoyl-CoA dioxygenase [Sphingomonas sp. Root50]KRB95562.1 phytanoyl-CoA dioxygenase [Sphingomonas sp. Root720]